MEETKVVSYVPAFSLVPKRIQCFPHIALCHNQNQQRLGDLRSKEWRQDVVYDTAESLQEHRGQTFHLSLCFPTGGNCGQ